MRRRFFIIGGCGAAALVMGGHRFRQLSEPHVAAAELPIHPKLRTDLLPALQVGDILFRGRDDSWGELGAMVSRRDQRYGHVGVVVRHGAGWSVISATGNPLAKEGRVQSESLDRFIGFSTRLGLYRADLSAAQMDDFTAEMEAHVTRATPFDRSYDLSDGTAVYCTELIWRGLNAVKQTDVIADKTIWRGRVVIALDDLQRATGLRPVLHLDIADKHLA